MSKFNPNSHKARKFQRPVQLIDFSQVLSPLQAESQGAEQSDREQSYRPISLEQSAPEGASSSLPQKVASSVDGIIGRLNGIDAKLAIEAQQRAPNGPGLNTLRAVQQHVDTIKAKGEGTAEELYRFLPDSVVSFLISG